MVTGHASEKKREYQMDTNKLRNVVFEQTGIRIDTTDPVFALVALNDAVLAEGVQRQSALVNDMAEQLATRTKVLLDAADRYQQRVQDDAPQVAVRKPPIGMWIAGGAGIALLSAALTLAGQSLLPRPEPQRITVPAPLTPEQSANMRNGEKIMRILPTLDAPVQAQVKELMEAP